jgi:hypothetical protein
MHIMIKCIFHTYNTRHLGFPSVVLIVFEIYALDAEHKNNKCIHCSAVDKH